MVRQKAITIYRGLSHLTRSLSRIVCRGQERPKGRKGTLRPDFQAYTRPRFFLKQKMSPQDAKRQLWGNPGIVSLRQFRDNEAWIQLGQESSRWITVERVEQFSMICLFYELFLMVRWESGPWHPSQPTQESTTSHLFFLTLSPLILFSPHRADPGTPPNQYRKVQRHTFSS